MAESRETIRLAFVAALQHLPPRQRAVLLLCEVLRWKAREVAELLEVTIASVNSALQRARATVSQLDAGGALTVDELEEPDRQLLEQYVAAFEAYDIEALVQLLHDDASMSMPPLALWLQGPDQMAGWYLGHGAGCRGSRLLPMTLNGQPGFAQYKPSEDGGLTAWSLQVLEIVDGRVAHIHHFLGDEHFVRAGMPVRLA